MALPDLIALSNLPWDSFFPAGLAPPLGREARTHVGAEEQVAPWLLPEARAQLEAEAIGGSPTNVALAFAGLGGRARVVGPVARDAWGDRVRRALAVPGLLLLEVTPAPPRQAHSLAFREPDRPVVGAPPETALHTSRGERRFLTTLPEVAERAALPRVDWTGPGWIVASSYEFRNAHFGALVRKAFGTARSAGRRCAVDLADPHAVRERRDEIRALLREGCDLVQGGTEAFEALWPEEALRLDAALLRTLAPIVIETRGAAGVRLVAPQVDLTLEALPVDIVDTTGAGDALLGAILFALARGDVPERAMELGRSVAALCVGQVGAHVPADRLRALAG